MYERNPLSSKAKNRDSHKNVLLNFYLLWSYLWSFIVFCCILCKFESKSTHHMYCVTEKHQIQRPIILLHLNQYWRKIRHAHLQFMVITRVKFHFDILKSIEVVWAKKYLLLLCNRPTVRLTDRQTDRPTNLMLAYIY